MASRGTHRREAEDPLEMKRLPHLHCHSDLSIDPKQHTRNRIQVKAAARRWVDDALRFHSSRVNKDVNFGRVTLY